MKECSLLSDHYPRSGGGGCAVAARRELRPRERRVQQRRSRLCVAQLGRLVARADPLGRRLPHRRLPRRTAARLRALRRLRPAHGHLPGKVCRFHAYSKELLFCPIKDIHFSCGPVVLTVEYLSNLGVAVAAISATAIFPSLKGTITSMSIVTLRTKI